MNIHMTGIVAFLTTVAALSNNGYCTSISSSVNDVDTVAVLVQTFGVDQYDGANISKIASDEIANCLRKNPLVMSDVTVIDEYKSDTPVHTALFLVVINIDNGKLAVFDADLSIGGNMFAFQSTRSLVFTIKDGDEINVEAISKAMCMATRKVFVHRGE